MGPATGFPVGRCPCSIPRLPVPGCLDHRGVAASATTGLWGRCLFWVGVAMGTTTGLRDGASFGRASRWVRLPVIGTVPLYRGAHLGVCWLRLAQPRASHASPSPSSPGSVTLVLDAGCASFAGGCRLLWSTAHGGCMRLSCAIGPTHLLHRPRRERLLWSTVLGVPPSPLGWLLWSTALAGAGLCFFRLSGAGCCAALQLCPRLCVASDTRVVCLRSCLVAMPRCCAPCSYCSIGRELGPMPKSFCIPRRAQRFSRCAEQAVCWRLVKVRGQALRSWA